MELIKITDLTNQLGISSRSLRYYEQMGLLQSVRTPSDKYRFYDSANTERLKQIMVLRKMQIPVKEIVRIYESADMSVVVETFVARIRAIVKEVDALTELRRVVNDFLQAMLKNGITKISALPILYEKMESQLELLERGKTMSYAELADISEKASKPAAVSILSLPAMRMLSSRMRSAPHASDADGFLRWAQSHGVAQGRPGRHEQFEYQTDAGDVLLLRITDDFDNDGPFLDYTFGGGLFAAANVYLDEDLGERFRSILSGFDNNPYYEIDYAADGGLRHEAMLEDLISPDEKRELVSLLVPVKKRLANPALYGKPDEIPPDTISPAEIEALNPALWEADVPLDKLTPINGPYYRMTELGEAEYTGWISTRVLSTNAEVKLPFRVDIEFRFDEKSARYAYGCDEGAIIFYHGCDLSYRFGVNMGNIPADELSHGSLCFHQPLFRDYYSFPGRGAITPGAYNKLTWIVGPKHFAVMINGEVRYCGVNFPYMTANMAHLERLPIIIGSNGQGMKYFRSIRVSQLAQAPNRRIKGGTLTMATRRSNNTVPGVRRFITSEHGENYWFNGCARYVMGALGDNAFDYEFFAGITGDVFAQVFAYDGFRGEGVTDFFKSVPDGSPFVEKVFATCGYAATFVPERQLKANREMYTQTLIAYIDKGVPVLSNLVIAGHDEWCVFVGYEEHGKTLLFQTDNMTEPERVSSDDVFAEYMPVSAIEREWRRGFIFVGEKKENVDAAKVYRDAILRLPVLLTTKNDKYCFGADAFRAWADEVEGGRFDGMKPEEFDGWRMYSTYVCNAATNGSCCHEFLTRAMALNPDMGYLAEISELYLKMKRLWSGEADSLESLGGGFNITLEALKDRTKRSLIAEKIRECAACVDEVVRVIRQNT